MKTIYRNLNHYPQILEKAHTPKWMLRVKAKECLTDTAYPVASDRIGIFIFACPFSY